MNKFHHYIRNDAAATAIEYALIAVGVAVAIAVSVWALGDAVEGQFVSISTSLNNNPTPE